MQSFEGGVMKLIKRSPALRAMLSIACAGLLLAALACLAVRGSSGQVTRSYMSTRKWEYTVHATATKNLDAKTTTELDLFGINGWELVSAHSNTEGKTVFVFKRPRSN
jgi:hypothetical protein